MEELVVRKNENNSIINKVLKYFLRGLVFISPIVGTIYIILMVVKWVDGLIPVGVPGLSLMLVIFNIVLIGYLGDTFIAKPFFKVLERAIRKIPLINFIYTSINDLTNAFFGEKKKFDQPVMVNLDNDDILFKPGFITSTDLNDLGMEGKIAVYFPHSYNFSGNLYIVNSTKVTKLNGNTSEVMKYIVSGGVSGSLGAID